MMRYSLFSILFCLFICTNVPVHGQEAGVERSINLPKLEFQINYGDATAHSNLHNFTDSYNYYWRYNWFDDNVYQNAYYTTGTINLSAHYRLARWFWLGANLNLTNYYGGNIYSSTTNLLLHKGAFVHLGLAPSIRFSYLNRSQIMLYSGFSLGAIWISNYNTIRPFYQLNLLGISVGEKWFGNAEIGIGMKGIISAGFGYRF